MKKIVSKNDFELAEKKMNELLDIATKRGGFKFLTDTETSELEKYTRLVKIYEDSNYIIETPHTVQELIYLKMY